MEYAAANGLYIRKVRWSHVMGKYAAKVDHNTKLHFTGGELYLRLHQSDIVHYRRDRVTEVRHHGFHTRTTVDRLNKYAANQHGKFHLRRWLIYWIGNDGWVTPLREVGYITKDGFFHTDPALPVVDYSEVSW